MHNSGNPRSIQLVLCGSPANRATSYCNLCCTPFDLLKSQQFDEKGTCKRRLKKDVLPEPEDPHGSLDLGRYPKRAKNWGGRHMMVWYKASALLSFFADQVVKRTITGRRNGNSDPSNVRLHRRRSNRSDKSSKLQGASPP